ERAERERLPGRAAGRDLRRGAAGRAALRRALQPRGRGLGLRRRRAAALTRLAESAWLLVRHVGSLPVVAELGDQRLEQLRREEPDARVRSGVCALAGAGLLEQLVEQPEGARPRAAPQEGPVLRRGGIGAFEVVDRVVAAA